MFTLFINVSYVYVYIFIPFSILITGILLVLKSNKMLATFSESWSLSSMISSSTSSFLFTALLYLSIDFSSFLQCSNPGRF